MTRRDWLALAFMFVMTASLIAMFAIVWWAWVLR